MCWGYREKLCLMINLASEVIASNWIISRRFRPHTNRHLNRMCWGNGANFKAWWKVFSRLPFHAADVLRCVRFVEHECNIFASSVEKFFSPPLLIFSRNTNSDGNVQRIIIKRKCFNVEQTLPVNQSESISTSNRTEEKEIGHEPIK